MEPALWAAQTGLDAQQTRMSVTANNPGRMIRTLINTSLIIKRLINSEKIIQEKQCSHFYRHHLETLRRNTWLLAHG